MNTEFLKEKRIALLYNETQSPSENINRFFETVKFMRYYWIGLDVNGKTEYYLSSAWQNEVGLRRITADFIEKFIEHLVTLSMDAKNENEYSTTLKECKVLLQKINHSYRPTFTDILGIVAPEKPGDIELIVHYESLPEELKESISRCYELFMTFFISLLEIVNDEQQELRERDHVRKTSTYKWIDEKNDFSELALAIFASGAVARKGNKKMMPSTFARDLAAFMGIENLNFDQDIALIGPRTKRPQGQFIDKCKQKLLKFFGDKYEK